jgi:uncharacterized membrane protein
MRTRLVIRIAALVLLGALYVLGGHWLMTRAPASPWNAVGVLAPMLVAIAIGTWRAGQRWVAGATALLIAALGAQALLGLQASPQRLYLAQHIGINAFLGLGFGSTLRAGHTPLITALAQRVHRHFPAPMALYTRHCTLAWTLYFVAIVVASLALYAFAPFDTWALFANLLSPISVALMFGGEYLLRYRLHPEFERASIGDAIRSYLQRAGKPPAAHHDPAA